MGGEERHGEYWRRQAERERRNVPTRIGGVMASWRRVHADADDSVNVLRTHEEVRSVTCEGARPVALIWWDG